MKAIEVLTGDAGAAGIRRLLLGREARALLRDKLGAILTDGASVGACRLRRARFKPRRKISAYYDVGFRRSIGADSPRPVAVTWAPDTGGHGSGAFAGLEADARTRGVAAPFRTLHAEHPDRGSSIDIYPLDPAFPGLVPLSDPSFAAELIGARTGELRVTPLRYRPGQRHVLRYDSDSREAARTFAKLYADERGVRAFRAAARLDDWLTGSGEETRVVRPLAYRTDLRALLIPAVRGTPLSDLLRLRSNGVVTRALALAGAAAAAIHGAPPSVVEGAEIRGFDAELSAVTRASAHIAALLPGVGMRIDTLLDRARELHARVPGEPPTVVHGDLKLDHLWVSADGVTVMDLDRCRLDDPALDVGKVLADLEWQDAEIGRAGPAAAHAFLNAYGAGDTSARHARARIYAAVLLARNAARRVPVFASDWRPRVERLVNRAESILAEVAAQDGARARARPAVVAH